MDNTIQDIEMVRLGITTDEEKAEYEENKIETNKKISKINFSARQLAKKNMCPICKKEVSSFCNSHSIPRFCLQNISSAGKVMSPLQNEIPSLGKDLGLKQAGTFHIICNDCDGKIFQDYENPDAYSSEPTNKMLSQIALKNYLLQISKRYEEYELYGLLAQQFPNSKDVSELKKNISYIDLQSYLSELLFATKAISSNSKNYHLCFFKRLDYVVPFSAQSSIAMVSDFEDIVINDLFCGNPKYEIKDIHIAVFPLKSSSVIIVFFKNGEKRYRRFSKQLNLLSPDDQLAAINYIIFSYSENVFLNPEIHKILQNDNCFMDVCRKTTDVIATFPFPNQFFLEKGISEFSLSKRNSIPNLLSQEYAL